MFNNDWDEILKDEIQKPYFINLMSKVKESYQSDSVYPPYVDLFKALKLCSFKDTKVLILGQDPYHNPDEANGLAFSVSDKVKRPPSLNNIYKELESDLDIKATTNDLTNWAKQGVLLLNTYLTVIKNKPLSHSEIGWESFTDAIIQKLSTKENMVFILWGNKAILKSKYLDETKCKIIKSPHPSPLSAYRGFFGSKPFSKTNEYLKSHNIDTIDWRL